MNQHYLYRLSLKDAPPAGDGDMKSWFYFYKWNTEGERFLPKLLPHYENLKEGDRVWVGFDAEDEFTLHLVGVLEVKRVYEESMRGMQEIWFETTENANPDATIALTYLPEVSPLSDMEVASLQMLMPPPAKEEG